MSPFRSVGARLSLAFAAIVVLALAVVWLIAVRPLKEKLVE